MIMQKSQLGRTSSFIRKGETHHHTEIIYYIKINNFMPSTIEYYEVETMELELISFDVWNTLLDLKTVFNALADEVARPKDEKINGIKIINEVYRELKDVRRLGSIADDKFLLYSQEELAKKLNINRDILLSILIRVFSRLNSDLVVIEDAVEVLREVKKMGLKIGIIGNVMFWPSTLTRLLLEKTGIAKYIDKQLYSDEYGLSKPDRRIFIKLCRDLNVKAENAMHVGDSLAEDVGGALSAGMRAVWINPSAKKIVNIANKIYVISRLRELLNIII